MNRKSEERLPVPEGQFRMVHRGKWGYESYEITITVHTRTEGNMKWSELLTLIDNIDYFDPYVSLASLLDKKPGSLYL